MGWIELAIRREQLVESKEKELLWSAVPALGIDPATESQEDVETQVGYPDSPTTRSGNSTEEVPSLREGSVSEGGQVLIQTSEEATAALSALPDSSQGETTRGEDGQPLIMPSESTDSPEEAGALSSGTSNSPTGEGGSVPVSRDGLPAKPGSSSTMTEDRNTNGDSSTTSPSSGKGSESN